MSNTENDIKKMSTEDLIRFSNISGGSVESEIQEELLRRFRCLELALSNLVKLKDYKDKHGKNEEYIEAKAKSWLLAKEVLKQI